jgi:hypothetical protein
MALRVRQFLRYTMRRLTSGHRGECARAHRHGSKCRPLLFETVEPRVLMAADVRTPIAANEGYLKYFSYYDGWLDPKYGHERSGETKATNPSGPSVDNPALGYDWSSVHVDVHATTVRHSDGKEGKPHGAINTDFEFANQIYAQAGITIQQKTVQSSLGRRSVRESLWSWFSASMVILVKPQASGPRKSRAAAECRSSRHRVVLAGAHLCCRQFTQMFADRSGLPWPLRDAARAVARRNAAQIAGNRML